MSSPAIRNSPDPSAQVPAIMLLPKSVTSIRVGSIPRKIQMTPTGLKPGEVPPIGATMPSSLITIRPASHSLPRQLSITTISNASASATVMAMATARGLSPHKPNISSFQRILNRLSPRSPPFDSQATARPHSPLLVGIEGLKVDELDFEVCVRCKKEMEREEVELKRVPGDGLQWVCRGGCECETVASVREEKQDPVGGESPQIDK
jgi:hypothetical protein